MKGKDGHGRHLRAFEDRKIVLLRTLDVRQIRRLVLGKRKASRMKSNGSIVHEPARNSYAFVIKGSKEELVFLVAGSSLLPVAGCP
jgi:hypothetical protein